MNNMFAMRYAIIQFMPYIETKEFANIGIIAMCPKTGYFDYEITTRYGRLTKFFPHLDGKIYKYAIESYINELDRIKEHINNNHNSIDSLREIFDHLTVPKETIIRSGGISVTMTSSPKDKLNELFDYYVCHGFIKGNKETELTKRITKFVKDIDNLASPFMQDKKIGDDLYSVRVPLAQMAIGDDFCVQKIIKPIYLAHDYHVEMMDKWSTWLNKINRLRSYEFLHRNTKILFTFETQENPNNNQKVTFDRIKKEASSSNIILIPSQSLDKIKDFVTK